MTLSKKLMILAAAAMMFMPALAIAGGKGKPMTRPVQNCEDANECDAMTSQGNLNCITCYAKDTNNANKKYSGTKCEKKPAIPAPADAQDAAVKVCKANAPKQSTGNSEYTHQ